MARPVSMSLHEQVRNTLLSEIERGLFDGDKIPAEPELCERFGVSRITIRRAVADLESLGVVTRRQGLGTFISPKTAHVSTMAMGGFSDTLTGKGEMTRRVLRAEVVEADEVAAVALGVSVGSPVFQLVRVFAVDGVPLSIDESWYSMVRYPLFNEKISATTSTYEVLRTEYGAHFHSVERRISVSFTTEESAAWLQRPENDALVLIEKTASDLDGCVIHVSRVEAIPSRLALTTTAYEDDPVS